MGQLSDANMNFKQHSLSLHSPIAAMADLWEYIADRDGNLKDQSLFHSFFSSIDTYVRMNGFRFSCYSRDWLAHENNKPIPISLHTRHICY